MDQLERQFCSDLGLRMDFFGESTPSNGSEKKGTSPQPVSYRCREAEKGGSTMQPSSQSASSSFPGASGPFGSSRRSEDLAYQVVTIASILMLLGGLWAF
jgi:hypothetical protein